MPLSASRHYVHIGRSTPGPVKAVWASSFNKPASKLSTKHQGCLAKGTIVVNVVPLHYSYIVFAGEVSTLESRSTEGITSMKVRSTRRPGATGIISLERHVVLRTTLNALGTLL